MDINIEKIGELVERADEIFLSAEGEKFLLEFIKVNKQIEEAEKMIKRKLLERGLAVSPDFSSIRGDKIQIKCRLYGPRFVVEDMSIVPDDYKITETRIKLDPDKIEELLVKGKLPQGIVERPREKQITFEEIE